MAGRVKVTNISRHVTEEILLKLFSFIGTVNKLTLAGESGAQEGQECMVEFEDEESARVAMHLSGTELADKALVVGEKPNTGMPLANGPVVAQMANRPRTHVAQIPSAMQADPIKAEEISRTIYVGNISTQVDEQQLMDFFSSCGPVAYVKMAGDGLQPTRFAFVEFASQETCQRALQMNGQMLADRPLKVNHSKNAINKPLQGIRNSMAQTMAEAQPLTSQQAGVRQSGVAWPVLETGEDVDQKLLELRKEMELKYKVSRRT
ncbi:hypothetical protein LPJ78_005011 [Coemansia sp. RSA 989]|nr:hypothetical protein LPJ68_005237 [Coemansia sp. RSA 1086]KAJ1747334.1 hypothetical protein LPJ79_005326 [Coemansia sp. RSA 1821]KAJ1861987.1 hypothetical protein LPJ78_005011 [Coemansia sp. RSA 989]KAJ1870960.1 hypothetical protein LPJ55_004264 [Coemansia sp. RSA 990]KAJ2632499.1 hypothetical protein H4R22_001206 [Coemansia sp. RSA 1290]KAJ2646405.1 hypothetical protein IWW40_005443 [Coemansia sp. RSA 1250]KAJ2668163.1 hypothetical protein IWW42_005408 [Coemansia sp. RSA 1085]